MSRRVATVAVGALLAAGLLTGLGCGGSGDDGTTTAVLTGVTESVPASSPSSTVPAGPSTVQIDTTQEVSPTATEPDAGDEEGIRVPATFTLADGKLDPAPITVPPTLPIAVTVTAKDGAAHKLLFNTTPIVRVDIEAGGNGTGSARIPGQRKGSYTVSIDGGAPVPALVAVDDAGP